MCDEKSIETIESLCIRLKKFVDAGLGDCKIRCFDGFLHDDAISIDPLNRICKVRGYFYDTNLGKLTTKLKSQLNDAFDEYYGAIDNVGDEYEHVMNFPVKIGDHIWRIVSDDNSELTYKELIVNGLNVMYDGTKFATVGNDNMKPIDAINLDSCWGKTAFKTSAEAAARLKELEDSDGETDEA